MQVSLMHLSNSNPMHINVDGRCCIKAGYVQYQLVLKGGFATHYSALQQNIFLGFPLYESYLWVISYFLCKKNYLKIILVF